MATNYQLSPWIPIYPGLSRAVGNQSYLDDTLPEQWVNIVRADLSQPQMSVFSTPASQLQDNGVTVRDFLYENFANAPMAMVGTNANFFDINDPNSRNVLYGLAISNQEQVSAPNATSPWSLLVTENNVASIQNTNDSPPPSSIYTAISGNVLLVQNGKSVAPQWPYSGPMIAARTAVGIAPPYLYLVTIDGLDTSDTGNVYGARHCDTAQWLLAAGAANGFNLDGGGSTTMARIDAVTGQAVLMNVPHGDDVDAGSERKVGNSFAIVVGS
jgi:Phosphodiester glycosidase